MSTNDPNTNTGGVGNSEEATHDASEDRFERLFDLASSNLQNDATIRELSSAERQEMDNIRNVLNVVDAGRIQATSEPNLDRIEERFFAFLAEEEPRHPWIAGQNKGHSSGATLPEATEVEVRTLGELVRLNIEDAPPSIPPELMNQLFTNGMPISDFMDVVQRPGRIGRVLKEAEAPTPTYMPILKWINGSLRGIMPTSNGAFLARRQKKSRRG
ncbi:MAG: hypothetical protein V4671_25085 [Armatimonadota bacterium]